MGMLSVAKREVQHVGGIALYLFISFGIFTTLKKLVLASYQIEFSALVPTVVGAFALAKVVVLLDMTPVATRLDTRLPIWMAALCKTLFYCAISAPILFTERILACVPRDRDARRSRVGSVDEDRSKCRVGQSHHGRLSLWLLPSLSRNCTPSRTR